MEGHPASSCSMSTLAQRLRRLAATRTTIDVAQMQFIEIDGLREAYGDRWPREKSRITAVASDYINKRLDPEDILIAGEDGFLLVFGERTGVICETVAQAIARGLNDFFLGEGDGPPTPSLEATHREMSIEEIARGFERAEAIDTPSAAPAPETDRVLYQPAWDVRHEAVTTYHAFIANGAPPVREPGYQFDAPADERRNYAAYDELMLRGSEEAIRDLVQRGRKALVGVSFHAANMTNESNLLKLLAIATHFDPGLAQYRIIRFAGVAPGYPRLRLERSIGLVHGRLPRISVSLNFNEQAISWLTGLPVGSVGFALPSHTIDTPNFNAQVLPKVKAAVVQAHQHKKTFFVEGPITPEKAARLMETGVDAIESPLIWSPVPAPRGARRWPASNLFALQA